MRPHGATDSSRKSHRGHWSVDIHHFLASDDFGGSAIQPQSGARSLGSLRSDNDECFYAGTTLPLLIALRKKVTVWISTDVVGVVGCLKARALARPPSPHLPPVCFGATITIYDRHHTQTASCENEIGGDVR